MDNPIIIVDYKVRCDESLNPPEVVEANELRALITIKTMEIDIGEIVEEISKILGDSPN